MNSFDAFRNGRFLGFDPMFSQLDRFLETATSKITWPPYNLAKLSEQMYQLQFALAGFSKDEIRVRQEADYLIIEGKMAEKQTGYQMLHQGISAKDFMVRFLLAEGVMVDDVEFDNGILSIQVQKPTENRREIEFKIRVPSYNRPTVEPVRMSVVKSPTGKFGEATSDLMQELRDEEIDHISRREREEHDAESDRIRREEEDAEERRAIQYEEEFGSDRRHDH